MIVTASLVLALLLLPLAATMDPVSAAGMAAGATGAGAAAEAAGEVACHVLGLAVMWVVREGKRRLLCPRAGCGRTYSTRGGMRQHIHAHGGSFVCDEDGCGAEFSSSSALKRHKESAHEGVRFDCDRCSASFTERRNLKRHKLVIHEGRRIKCEHRGCGRRFILRSSMRQHMRREHPAVTPVSPGCRVDLRFPVAMNAARNQPDATLPCYREGCPRVFRTDDERERHLVGHPQFRRYCPIQGCDKSCVTGLSLRMHIIHFHGESAERYFGRGVWHRQRGGQWGSGAPQRM